MVRRFLFILLLILIVAVLAKPSGTWKELKRIWSQKDWLLQVLAVVISAYFIYGLYRWFSQ